MPRFSFESDPGEREPLDETKLNPPSPHHHHLSPSSPQALSPSATSTRFRSQQQYAPIPTKPSTPSPTRHPQDSHRSESTRTNATSTTTYNSNERGAVSGTPSRGNSTGYLSREGRGTTATTSTSTSRTTSGRSGQDDNPPPPPPHHHPSTINRKPIGGAPSSSGGGLISESDKAMSRGPQLDEDGRYWSAEAGYPQPPPSSGITPGADNFSEQASGGGMSGIAYNVAEQHSRQGGMDSSMQPADPRYPQQQYRAPQGHGGQQYDQQQRHHDGYDQYSTGGYDQRPQQQHQQHQPAYSTNDSHQTYLQQRGGAGGGYDTHDNRQQPQQAYDSYPPQASPRIPTSPYHDSFDQSGYDGHAGYGSPSSHQTRGRERDSGNSVTPFGAAGANPGRTPGYNRSDSYDQHHDNQRGPYAAAPGAAGMGYGIGGDDMYSNDPYRRYGQGGQQEPRLGQVNPNDIADDGDDGLEYRRPARASLLSLGRSSNHDGSGGQGIIVAGKNRLSGIYNSVANSSARSLHNNGNSRHDAGPMAAGALGGGAVAAGAAAGAMHDGSSSTVDGGGSKGEVVDHYALNKAAKTDGLPSSSGGSNGGYLEKPSDWLKEQDKGRKKWKWLILGFVILLVLGGVAAGVVFGVVLKDNGGSGSGGSDSSTGGGGQTAEEDIAANGDLNIQSQEIQDLMGNKDLHRVFAAMDYTALNTQYPDCVKWPPSQNNVTRDMAVLSQLTNTVRVYGTDCNQTQMVLHAIQQLEMQDSMRMWMGVWQDANETTNARQLDQMWDILDEYGRDPFEGVIVANEILFREEMTSFQLSTILSEVRTNLSSRGWDDFIVATSDLGDNWTSELARISDAIMGNIHPFFAGIDVSEASEWTTTFWDNKIGLYRKPENKLNIIAETGWPTGGGSINSSVAGIPEMNSFMDDWVCRAMDEKINYFWFEAFDEPWKVRFNEEGREWEDKWGLLTVNRELKEGVKIPDCGGRVVDDINW